MSAHTPGPWHVNKGPRNALPHIRSATGLYVMDAAPRGSNAMSTTRQMADAVLIAAAPELLEALRNSLSLLEIHCGNSDDIANVVMDKARAAIAKATGEQA